ncbi:MAG: DUF6036 family nucleotidyltransferase [Betaproteobacteria bacterium]
MRSPLAEALAALGRALEGLGARWYLFGAQAALLYGAARLTADVDVTVMLGTRQNDELVRALEDAGFRLRIADARRFVAKTRVLPFLDPRSGMPIDVVLAGPGLEEVFLRRRRRRRIDGVPVFVASAEDVVVMKVLAGRGKDEDDVLAILAAQSRLDLRHVRKTLVALEAALGQADLRPSFESLLLRARASRPATGSSRRRRRRWSAR